MSKGYHFSPAPVTCTCHLYRLKSLVITSQILGGVRIQARREGIATKNKQFATFASSMVRIQARREGKKMNDE
jgi:hypothetical protein